MGRLTSLFGVVLWLALSAGARGPQTPDITNQNVDSLSLEELMNMEVTLYRKDNRRSCKRRRRFS